MRLDGEGATTFESLRLPFRSSLNHIRKDVKMFARLRFWVGALIVPLALFVFPLLLMLFGEECVSRLGALCEWSISPWTMLVETAAAEGAACWSCLSAITHGDPI